ncbi:MAG: HAD-superfamily subfamily hydrolase [Solirubrobacterales bacterium]|nr:HAD-superfamily subfamily hydrolase [Solirubrobacterales bacterium]
MAEGAEAQRSAAFFDLDKTLMAGSSGMVFARAASAHGMVSRGQMLRWGRDHLRYRLRGSTDDETKELLKVAREAFKGVPQRDIARMGPEVLAGILPRIYPEMLSEVHRHQDEGRATFIVSAAGNEMVAQLAQVLGMEGGIGTSYEVGPDGLYTGRLNGPFVYGQGKVEAMRRFAADHDIDLERSYAYSDSASDMPMLCAVGNAVVVNPDDPLALVAKAEGWRVLRFEKLGRRIAVAGATAVAAAVGTLLASRRRESPRPRRLR